MNQILELILCGSSSLGRELRKIVFAYVRVWGAFLFSFVFLSQPQPVGEPSTWDLDKPLCVHRLRSPREFFPVSFVMSPNSRADRSFPNPRLMEIGGITFLEPALSYLSMFHSCKLEILPQLNCVPPFCLGNAAVHA